MPRLALLCVLLWPAFAHAEERRERVFPEHTHAVAAMSTGGALVLEYDSPRLLMIDRTGAREVVHPDVGPLDAIADERWILGRQALLHRTEEWHRIELSPLPGVPDARRLGHVVTLAPDRVVVVRMHEGGTVVELVEATGAHTVVLTLANMSLARPVPDGRGGFWVIVRMRSSPDGYSGYAHYRDGQWRLWRQTMAQTSSYVKELPPMQVADAADNAILDAMAYTGDGGVLARWYTQLYRIAADGTISMLTSTKTERVCAIVPTKTGHLVVSTANLSRIDVVSVDASGSVSAPAEIALPTWYTSAHFRPSVFDCEASLVDDKLWISSGPFVLERTAAGFNTYVSTAVVRETEQLESDRHPNPAALAIPPLAIIGIGVFGGAALRDDASYTSTTSETLMGTVGGLPAALLLDVLADNPCVEGNDSGYQIYNDMACVIRGGGYLVALGGGGALGALGTYTAGKEFDDLPSERNAYLGAFAGGTIGAALSIASTKLMRRWVPQAGRLSRSILAATLIGAGSTIGYQLGR